MSQDFVEGRVTVLSSDRLRIDLRVGKKGETNKFRLTVSHREQGLWPSRAAREGFPKRLPERHAPSEGMGSIVETPATDVAVQVICETWDLETQVSFSEDARVVFDYLRATMAYQESAIARTARYHEWCERRDVAKVAGEQIPAVDFVEDWDLPNGLEMMTQQRVGLANCLHTDGYMEGMEQGTGKTAVVIKRVDVESAQVHATEGRLHRTLIVAPKNVRGNWAREFERFSTEEGVALALRGGAVERQMMMIQGLVPKTPTQRYVAYVISYEALSLMWEVISAIEWDLAVLDESHFIKWARNKRSKKALELRDISKARMCLSGTPVCNTPADLYAQLEFLREGGSGFSNFEAFRRFYGVYKMTDSERGVSRLVRVQNLPFMKERLSRCAFMVRKKEALPDLPDKTYDLREVDMTPEQQKIYDTLCEELWLEIEDDVNTASERGERSMTIQNILTKLLRLAQVTSGFLSLDPIQDLASGETVMPRTIKPIEPNPKVDVLKEEFFDEDGDPQKDPLEKTIVCCTFVYDILRCHRALSELGLDPVLYYGGTSDKEREENERRFNEDSSCRVMILNPAAAAQGLNLVGYDWWRNPNPRLDTNTTQVIFYSQNWSLPQRAQVEDRPHRSGTRTKVRYTDLTVPKTIDEEIRLRVLNKRLTALEIQDLRSVVMRVLKKE